MWQAGAVISVGSGSAEEKRAVLTKACVAVADLPLHVPLLLRRLFTAGKRLIARGEETKRLGG
jgi:succinyl-CoA synthetase alpha subunit